MKTLIFAFLVIILLSASAYFFLFQSDQQGTSEELSPQVQPSFTYQQRRWNHIPLSLHMESVSPVYTQAVLEAIKIWENTTKNKVQFKLVDSVQADINIRWVNSLSSSALDAAGDARTKFTEFNNLSVITKADIELLKEFSSKQLGYTDMLNLALHEIGHALGLDHSNNKESVMYPQIEFPSKSVKSILQSDAEYLISTYNIPAKPDLIFSENASAVKFSKKILFKEFFYVNLSFIVENIGIVDSPSINLTIKADNTTAKADTLPTVAFGSQIQIIYQNLMVDRNFQSLEIIVDQDNSVDELDESNNVVTFVLK